MGFAGGKVRGYCVLLRSLFVSGKKVPLPGGAETDCRKRGKHKCFIVPQSVRTRRTS